MERNIALDFLLVLFLGIGIAALMPYIFVGQIIKKNLLYPVHRLERKAFSIAILLIICILFITKNAYTTAMQNIEKMKQSNYETLQTDYITERILGMHFIYHTRIEPLDGWRPPLHDPFMVIGMRLNGDIDPLPIGLRERVLLYKKFFPDRPTRYTCRCAPYDENGRYYHTDKVLD